MKIQNNMDLREYLEENQSILLTLSIFLLLTFTLVSSGASLNNVIGILSAIISYILLFVLVSPQYFRNGSLLLGIFLIVLLIFIPAFCSWVILNLIITLSGELTIIIGMNSFLILMLIPSIRLIIVAVSDRKN